MRRLRVTDVLSSAGLIDSSYFTTEARDRGTAVHLATQFYDEHDVGLDERELVLDSLTDAKARARVETYIRFRKECACEVLQIESTVTHETLGYVGHPDRLVRIGCRLTGILDIKPPGARLWHGLQLAAYQAAAGAAAYPMRWNLYLGEKTYHLEPRKELRDWHVFQAALFVAQFKEAGN